MTNALLIYIGLLALAAVEAFTPTAYLIPGTLGVVAAGGLVEAGKLNPFSTLFVVWTGVVIGDIASFLLAKKFGDLLRRWDSIATGLGRAETRLTRHPVAFMLLSHLSPFLKNTSAPAAGLVGWSFRRFLALEIPAALMDAVWFLSIGYVAGATVGNVTEMPLAARIVGVVALVAVVVFLIGRGRKCRLPRQSSSPVVKAKRGLGFLFKCLILIGPWEIGGRLAKRAGFYERPEYRAAFSAAIDAADVGDVVLVGRPVEAPWGQFSHAMLVVKTPVGKALIHAYETDVQLTPVKAAPMCGRVAVIQLTDDPKKRERIAQEAWKMLGTPFALWMRQLDLRDPKTLNCIGLVALAANRASLTLRRQGEAGYLVPDDLLLDPNAKMVFQWIEGEPKPIEEPSRRAFDWKSELAERWGSVALLEPTREIGIGQQDVDWS